jgi:hypothetical protein
MLVWTIIDTDTASGGGVEGLDFFRIHRGGGNRR